MGFIAKETKKGLNKLSDEKQGFLFAGIGVVLLAIAFTNKNTDIYAASLIGGIFLTLCGVCLVIECIKNKRLEEKYKKRVNKK